MTILAGDVGGTKTRLALYERTEPGNRHALEHRSAATDEAGIGWKAPDLEHRAVVVKHPAILIDEQDAEPNPCRLHLHSAAPTTAR